MSMALPRVELSVLSPDYCVQSTVRRLRIVHCGISLASSGDNDEEFNPLPQIIPII